MLVLAVPIGVLFSTLMAFGGMAASHEITIIKASGGSLWRMMTPLIISGALLTAGLFWFNDEVLPEANHQAKVLMIDINRKKPTFSIEAGQFSTAFDGYTILARQVDSVSGNLRGVTIYDNSKSNSTNVISADSGVIAFTSDYSKLIINMYQGEAHQFNVNNVKNYRKTIFSQYQILINASGFNFSQSDINTVSRGDREMHIRDMQKIVDESMTLANSAQQRIQSVYKRQMDFIKGTSYRKSEWQESEGTSSDTSYAEAIRRIQSRVSFVRSAINSDLSQYNDYSQRAKSYIVEIQKKYAIPFACLIFVFVGCPFGIITRGGNFGFSAAITLGFYVFYWACLIGGEKLADRGLISPVLSMWLGNILLGVFGLILTIKINNESMSFPGWHFFKRNVMKIIDRFKKK